MIQFAKIAVHNIGTHKVRTGITVLLCVFVILLTTISISVVVTVRQESDKKEEEIQTKKIIQIMGANGQNLSNQVLDLIRQEEGVADVVPWYNTTVLMEDSNADPMYIITLNGFDFDKWRLPGADDFRGKSIEGVVLPDITYEFRGNKVLRDYVGQEVRLTYDCIEEGTVVSKTISVPVIGVYEAYGPFEANPVFISKNLFQGILEGSDESGAGVFRAYVYPLAGADLKDMARRIAQYGVDVSYETLLDEYLSFVRGFARFVLLVDAVVVLLSLIVLSQNLKGGVRRRYKEFGVLKAYGHPARLMVFSVFFEWLMYWGMSVLVSFALWAIGRRTIAAMAENIIKNGELVLEGKVIMISCGIVGAVSALTMLVPIQLIQRMQPIDVLKETA